MNRFFALFPFRYLHLAMILALSICTLNSFAQQIVTEIHNKNVGPLLAMEKKLGNKVFIKDGDIIIPGGMAEPLVYRRSQNNIPDLLVTYTFSSKDSLLHSIEYEIDMINFDSKANVIPRVMQKAMIKKYNELLDQLTNKIGQSEQKGSLIDLSKIDQRGGLSQSNTWMPNDTTYISLYSVFSNYEEQKENIVIKATNRIRLNISKMKKPAPELSPKNLQIAKQTFDQFITKLRAGDQVGAKAFFSPQIQSMLTETVFNQLKESIKPEAFKIYTKAMQVINETQYLVIQYADVDAPDSPKEIVRIVYDKNNQIIGIQPLVAKN